MEILVDEEKGIKNPTRVRVDKEGKRLAVINKGGNEIRTYELHMVNKCQIFIM